MTHFLNKWQFTISDEARNLCSPKGISRSYPDEALWLGNGTRHCLLFLPSYRYNAEAGGGSGSWEISNCQGEYVVGRQREFFHLHRNAWYYYGIFECVGMSFITTEDVLKLSTSRIVDNIHKRTILHSDLVPPLITKMVQNMYAQGVLKVHCIGLRCVGFNHGLDNALRSKKQSKNVTPHIIPIPGNGPTGSSGSASRKRGHSGGHGQSKRSKNN